MIAALALIAGLAWGTPPAGTLMFSPNGDGVRDDVTFKLSVQADASIRSWLFEIKDEAGALVRNFSGQGRPPAEVKWDGKDIHDKIVKDGTYLFTLALVTPAGNQTAIAPSPVIVDRVSPTAEASVSPEIFSPNSTAGKNETQFSLKASDAYGIYSWLLAVKDKDGAPVRSLGGKGVPPAAVKWDGRGDFEEDAPDGTYSFELTVEDPAGNRATTTAGHVTIKREGAVSTIEVSPLLFSPNADGYKDEVTFRFTGGDPESVDRWSIKILNQNGKLVHEFTGLKEPPHRIVWDGRLSDKRVAPDGPYQVILSETDLAGNTAVASPQPMVIDTTPPRLQARLEPDLISPTGKGYHSEGKFNLKSEDANPLDKWTLKIVNDVGAVVKSWSGPQGSKPTAEFVWKGDSNDGQPLIDGAYSYFLEATDVGGNKAVTPKQTLRIDNTPPVITVSCDPQLFSPNGAANKTAFALKIVDASALESWSLKLTDAQSKVVRSFTSPPDAVPSVLEWDGKSQDRIPLPDGDYTYVVSAKDVAGNVSASAPQKVTIGATRPVPEITSELRAISPNADGVKDDTGFHLQVKAFNRMKEWSLKILDKAGQAQRTFLGRGDAPGLIRWGGERDDKHTLPDGEYTYILEAIDVAGNRAQSLQQQVRIDTTKPDLIVSASPALFSPNGDGLKDETVFIPTYKDASPIGDWRIAIKNSTGKVVKRFEGTDKLPLSVAWKGEADDGAALPDGAYTFTFSAADEVGNRSTTAEQIVRIDNTPPEIALQADPPLFSPAIRETTFLLDVKDASDLSSWKLVVTGKDGPARTFSGIGRPPRSFPWNGKDDHNHELKDGPYIAQLSVTDEVGNAGKSPEVTVTLDTAKPMATVTAETSPLQELVPQMNVVQAPNKDLVISLSSEILFDTGQATLKDQAYATLMRAGYLIRRYPQRKVIIEGHADNVPIHNETFKHNLALSQARAESVMAFFVEKATIDAERMTAVGMGDKRPRASNDTEEGRKANRRVEIIIKESKDASH